jgi:hypothetical protein
MAIAAAIQQATVVPSADGHRVQLYVSDKPPVDEASAALVLTLRAQIGPTSLGKLTQIQLAALGVLAEALRPLKSEMYD